MAKPVTEVPEGAQAASLPPGAPLGDDAAAILAALSDAGVLAFLRALVEQREVLSEQLLTKLNTEPTRQGVKNLVTLSMGLGALPQEAMPPLLAAVGQGLHEAQNAVQAEGADKTSLWTLLGLLKDPDIARSIHYLAGFLKGMGQALKS